MTVPGSTFCTLCVPPSVLARRGPPKTQVAISRKLGGQSLVTHVEERRHVSGEL